MQQRHVSTAVQVDLLVGQVEDEKHVLDCGVIVLEVVELALLWVVVSVGVGRLLQAEAELFVCILGCDLELVHLHVQVAIAVEAKGADREVSATVILQIELVFPGVDNTAGYQDQSESELE